MNDHEAQRLAAAAHELRPDWPVNSVLTLIRSNLMNKPRRDVAVALAWIACEADTKTPKRVLETGPWWKAAGAEVSDASRLADKGPWCKNCGTGPDSSTHRSGECEYVLWPSQYLQEERRLQRLAELRAEAAEHKSAPPLTIVRDEPTNCGPDCIRGAGHTGPHWPPAIPTTPMREVPMPDTTEPAVEIEEK